MADIGLNISTNILIHPFETWDDVPLSPFFRAKVEELNLKLQPTHKYGLGPILEGKSLMITSPSGTMRSSCAIIGILHLVDLSLAKLQAIVLIPSKKLIEEAMQHFSRFSYGLKINIVKCVGGERLNKSELLSAQIIVVSVGKLEILLKNQTLDLSYLKIVVLDVANALFLKDMKAYTDEVLRKLSNKHIYWFSSPVPDEVTKEVFLKTKPDGVVVDIEDQRVLHVVKFYFKFYQTEQDQFLFIRKQCEEYDGQLIIFSCDIEELDRLSMFIADFDPLVLNDFQDFSHQVEILKQVKKGEKKVLLSFGTFHLVRKIECKRNAMVINVDIPTKNLLISRARRADFKPNDKFLCFFKDYEEQELESFENEVGIKFFDSIEFDD